MSIASKAELSVLSHEEQEMVRVTHHPAIYELDGEALKSLQRRLREQRGKMRTFVRQKRRDESVQLQPELSQLHVFDAAGLAHHAATP